MIQVTGSPTLGDPLLLTTEEAFIADSHVAQSRCGASEVTLWKHHDFDLAPNSKHTAWVAGGNVSEASFFFSASAAEHETQWPVQKNARRVNSCLWRLVLPFVPMVQQCRGILISIVSSETFMVTRVDIIVEYAARV